MNNKQLTILIFLIVSYVCFASPRESFDNYKAQILEANGKEAIKYVSKKTIEYYSSMLNHALESKKEIVDKMIVMDRLMIYSMRVRVKPEELRKMDGESILIYGIDNGWIGKNSIRNFGSFDIEDDPGTKAKVMIMEMGNVKQRLFLFYNEDGIWKVDLISINAVANMSFKMSLKDIDPDEDRALLALLSSLEGRKIALEELYKPIGK